MDDFIIKLLLSFVIGSVWIVLLSIFSERFGSKVGGAIAGIPATMVVSLFFIALTQDPSKSVESTTVIPLMLGINALLVLIFILCNRFGFTLSLVSSLFFWFLSSFLLKLTQFNNFTISIMGFIMCILLTYYLLEYRLNIRSVKGKKIVYTIPQITLRGIIAGTTILISVVLAKVSGPLLGGIFASFPALTVALIFIMHLHNDDHFTAALLKNFIVVGTINVLIFTLSVRYTYLKIGILYGTALSITLSIVTAYLLYHGINKRMS